jgi:hypothetical protein
VRHGAAHRRRLDTLRARASTRPVRGRNTGRVTRRAQ